MADADQRFTGGTRAAHLSPAHVEGSSPNVTGAARWISIIAGGALATAGARRGGPLGIVATIAGTAILARGVTQQDPLKRAFSASPDERDVARRQGWSTAALAAASVTVIRSRDECYAFFRDFNNLPRFMEHIERVEVRDERHSTWHVKGPGGYSASRGFGHYPRRSGPRMAFRIGGRRPQQRHDQLPRGNAGAARS